MLQARNLALRAALSVMFVGGLWQAQADHKELKPGFNMFSKEQDVQLGREAASQVERQMPLVRDDRISSYVESIGRRLSSSPEAGGFPYTFKVVNDPAINAFALPGGPTYVNTGLIRAADNEAQLAGVMAHEIAHVALRHGTNQASKANLIQLPAMLAGGLVGGGSVLGQLAQLGIGLGANSVLLKFSRSAETEADLLGAQLMAKAGYDPTEIARFFQKLESQGGRGGPEFLSSHPNPGNRMKNIQEEIRTLPRRNYTAGNNGQLRQIQSVIGGLPQPTPNVSSADRTGSISLPRPSGSLTEYRGRGFSIAHPENWEAFGQSDSAMLTVAPRQGLVQTRNGGTAVGMGTVVAFYHPRYNDGRVDLDRETRDLLAQLQSTNPNMQVESNPRRVRVGNQNALSTVLSSASPIDNGGEVDLLITAARPQGLFYAVFVAPESQARELQSLFDSMIRSIRFYD